MKNVMKMFIATAVMGIFTVSAFAQGAGPGGQKGQAGGGNGQTERKAGGGGGQRRGGMNMDGEIFAKLNLTDGQKTKIKALKESTQKKMQELMKGAGGPGAGAGAKGGGKGEAGGRHGSSGDETPGSIPRAVTRITAGRVPTPSDGKAPDKGAFAWDADRL